MGLVKTALQKVKDALAEFKSKFDKGGAYTGDPSFGSESPEQDADDL